MSLQPSKRVAIVTGAARGIGRAISEVLLEQGWYVVLADVSPSVHDDLPDHDGVRSRVCTVVGNVTSPQDREQIIAAALRRFGRIDALVNNAGVGGPDKDILDVSTDQLQQVLDVNLVAAFDLARQAATAMLANGHGGRIVNLGSVFGQQAVARGAAYCASKGAVTLLTQSLALELGPRGITANTVAPGYILTDMHATEIALRAEATGRSFDDERDAMAQSVPLRRHGTPEDVAGCVAWLLSDAASYITGQTISVNGGILLS